MDQHRAGRGMAFTSSTSTARTSWLMGMDLAKKKGDTAAAGWLVRSMRRGRKSRGGSACAARSPAASATVVKDTVSAEDYYADAVAGRRQDPTLLDEPRRWLSNPRALLKDYLNDPVSDNDSALLVLDAAKDLTGASRAWARRDARHTPVPALAPRPCSIVAPRCCWWVGKEPTSALSAPTAPHPSTSTRTPSSTSPAAFGSPRSGCSAHGRG